MNKNNRQLPLLLGAFAFASALALFVLPVHAQTAADTSSGISQVAIDTAAAAAVPFIVSFAQTHPWLVTFLAIVATLRIVFKPIVSVVELIVKSTPSTADDAFVAKAEASTAFKIFAWGLDYLGSIKVGPQFTAAPAAKTDAQAAPRTEPFI